MLAGYSVGAAVTLRALSRGASPDKAIVVAPPVGMMSAVAPSIPSLAILGSDDTIVDAESTAAFFADHTVTVLDGADHFFMGFSNNIKQAIGDYLGA